MEVIIIFDDSDGQRIILAVNKIRQGEDAARAYARWMEDHPDEDATDYEYDTVTD